MPTPPPYPYPHRPGSLVRYRHPSCGPGPLYLYADYDGNGSRTVHLDGDPVLTVLAVEPRRTGGTADLLMALVLCPGPTSGWAFIRELELVE